MPHAFHKHKLLLDENMPGRQHLPRLNSHFNVRHLGFDLHKGGIADPEVYAEAVDQQRLLVTFNFKDFTDLASRSTETGVIGVTANMPTDQIDKKLTALLVRAGENDLLGKLTVITGETGSKVVVS